jgi:putative GTP pyrophosphokinase
MPSMKSPDLAAEYRLAVPRYDLLLAEVLFSIETAVKRESLTPHLVTGRVKTLESYLDKVQRKEPEAPSEIRDLVGVRIVCLLLSDLPKMRNLIETVFDVVGMDDKVESADPTVFGYMSVHYICRLRDNFTGDRYDTIKDMYFEIQCRTIVMDAWANVSHYLAYKGNASVPNPLKRDFNALSGLFYVADQHFEMVFSAANSSREAAHLAARSEESKIPQIVPINLDTVLAFFERRFPDREHSEPAGVSEFVEELSTLTDLETISDLDAAIAEGEEEALADEANDPPHGEEDGEVVRYIDIGFARTALDFALPSWRSGRAARKKLSLLRMHGEEAVNATLPELSNTFAEAGIWPRKSTEGPGLPPIEV